MKKYFSFNGLCVFFVSVGMFQMPVIAEESAPGTDRELNESVGYYFGYTFGNMLKEGGNEDVDVESLKQGLADSLDGIRPDLTTEEQREVIELIRTRQQEAQERLDQAREEAEARQSEMGDENLEKAEAFMEENAEKSGVQTTASGLQYEIVEEGSGPKPAEDSQVMVHYEGRLVNGEVFDSSRERGSPAEFGLRQVIPGWTEGLQLMKEGGKATFYIPPELGYGPGGTPSIPPNSVLIFDVELLEVK